MAPPPRTGTYQPPRPRPSAPLRDPRERARNDGPRLNRDIRVPEVRLIDEDGEMVGVVQIREALMRAEQAGLDLVEISPQAVPPVCKILDYGKFKYENDKKAAEARKKQVKVELKEIKIRPNTDQHDYDVKMKQARKFLDEGDKIKFSLRFKGREMSHTEYGLNMMNRIKKDLEALIRIEFEPKFEGRQVIMIVAPLPKAAAGAAADKPAE